jgi:hypothetical protein
MLFIDICLRANNECYGVVTLIWIPVLIVSGVLTSKEVYNSFYVLPFSYYDLSW